MFQRTLSMVGICMLYAVSGGRAVHADVVEYIWNAEFAWAAGPLPGPFSDLAVGDTVEMVVRFDTDDAVLLPQRDMATYFVQPVQISGVFLIAPAAPVEVFNEDAKTSILQVRVAESENDDYSENLISNLVTGPDRGDAIVQTATFSMIVPPGSLWQDGQLPTQAQVYTEFLGSFISMSFSEGTRRGGVPTFWALTRLEIKPIIDCPGDTDGDLDVDLDDLLDVIANWGSDGSGGGDSNGDELVDLDDLLEVIANWGTNC